MARSGPNYDAAAIAKVEAALAKAGLPRAGDRSTARTATAGKDPVAQRDVGRDVAAQVAAGNRGIIGVMLESFLVEGRQDRPAGHAAVYGQSITDACMSWERSVASPRGAGRGDASPAAKHMSHAARAPFRRPRGLC